MAKVENGSKLHYTIVVKLGSSSLCDEDTRQHKIAIMSQVVEMAVNLRKDGHRVIIVSSGAIAIGLKRMNLNNRPKSLVANQALSAIGQTRLIGLWDDLFRQLDQPIAQILLSKGDMAERSQYLNAANTLNELINMGIIPIINENDTISMQEIRFGDNDTLSAITASMVHADYLFLMTDVDCLYTANPRLDPNAKPILVVSDVSQLRVDVSSPGSRVGTGGMTTKLIAAELATTSGVTMIICKSSVPGNVHSIVRYIQSQTTNKPDHQAELEQSNELDQLVKLGIPLHTRFLPREAIKNKQFWLLHGLTPHGKLYVDSGAMGAITRTNRAGLLPVGIIAVEGIFHSLECVSIFVASRDEQDKSKLAPASNPKLIGRALVNYSSAEIDRIKGLHSDEISKELGWSESEYIAYRDNMAFFAKESVIAK